MKSSNQAILREIFGFHCGAYGITICWDVTKCTLEWIWGHFAQI